MADYNPTAQQQTQDPLPLLQDDLLKDRIRQFVEFLDDEVSSSCCLDYNFSRSEGSSLADVNYLIRHKRPTTTDMRPRRCWITTRTD
jgi:hypothetical protein